MRQIVLEDLKQKSAKAKSRSLIISKLGFRDWALLLVVLFSISLTINTYISGSEYFTHLAGATFILVLIVFIKFLGSIKTENS